MREDRVLAVALAAVLLSSAGCGSRGDSTAPGRGPGQVTARVHALLAKDCATGDPDSAGLLQQIGAMGKAAYPVLWGALRHGPSDLERRRASENAKVEYARIRRFLSKGGLSDKGVERVRQAALQMDESDYVALQVGSFVQGFHEHALGLLVSLRAPGLPESLRAIARDPAVPPAVRDRIVETMKE